MRDRYMKKFLQLKKYEYMCCCFYTDSFSYIYNSTCFDSIIVLLEFILILGFTWWSILLFFLFWGFQLFMIYRLKPFLTTEEVSAEMKSKVRATVKYR